jgi:nitrate reductase NapE component
MTKREMITVVLIVRALFNILAVLLFLKGSS